MVAAMVPETGCLPVIPGNRGRRVWPQAPEKADRCPDRRPHPSLPREAVIVPGCLPGIPARGTRAADDQAMTRSEWVKMGG